MDGLAATRPTYNRWLPYWAVYQADVNQTQRVEGVETSTAATHSEGTSNAVTGQYTTTDTTTSSATLRFAVKITGRCTGWLLASRSVACTC